MLDLVLMFFSRLINSKFNILDKETNFRLINSFLVSISISLLLPILITLKGTYMEVYVIALFSITETLAVKTNAYIISRFNISNLYQFGIFIHIILMISTSLYFYNPELMIYLNSSLVILEITVFSSYSIILNSRLASNFPESTQTFHILRNSIWADGFIIGLILVTCSTYFFNIAAGIITFEIFGFLFVLWMIKNWNFYK